MKEPRILCWARVCKYFCNILYLFSTGRSVYVCVGDDLVVRLFRTTLQLLQLIRRKTMNKFLGLLRPESSKLVTRDEPLHWLALPLLLLLSRALEEVIVKSIYMKWLRKKYRIQDVGSVFNSSANRSLSGISSLDNSIRLAFLEYLDTAAAVDGGW